jgi:hypothetical protein
MQFAYSDEMGKRDIILSSLIRQSARRYGRDLPCLPLRYAVAALSARLIPLPQLESSFRENKSLARQELRAKIQRPENIIDSDVFAVFLVFILEKLGSGVFILESRHTNGFVRMFRNCVKNLNGELSADSMLMDFGPLLLDWLELQTLSNPSQWYQTYELRQQIFGNASSFRQRIKYFPTEQTPWSSSEGWALQFTVTILTYKLCFRIAELATKELSPTFQRKKFREDVQQSIDLELEDGEFQKAVLTSESWQESIPTRYILLFVY